MTSADVKGRVNMARTRGLLRTLFIPALLLAMLVAIASCTVPQNNFAPASDRAQSVMSLYIFLIVAASIVGGGVLFGTLYLIVRYRARPGVQARQIHGNNLLEIGWTLVPIFVLVIIAIPTIIGIAGAARPPRDEALHIRVVGHQWWWEVEYEDIGPNGGALRTANEIFVPVGREIAITLESNDVIHSFWVPKLVGKTDAIPNRVNRLESFTPFEIGTFYGQCAEFCGAAHALMRFRVHVLSQGDFNRWVQALQTPPAPVGGLAEEGRQLFFGAAGCIACHAIAGTIAQGQLGPDLTRFGSRDTLGAGVFENTPENLHQWIYDLRSMKPIPDEPRFMPSFGTLPADDPRHLTNEQVDALVAYLESMRVE
ncbi:MAG: cytochrome c oxidase subunit II [SAR202 cluster bacterium]|nr:cytochrome c oxidase subunit II [SAR202 cluster bacterium]